MRILQLAFALALGAAQVSAQVGSDAGPDQLVDFRDEARGEDKDGCIDATLPQFEPLVKGGHTEHGRAGRKCGLSNLERTVPVTMRLDDIKKRDIGSGMPFQLADVVIDVVEIDFDPGWEVHGNPGRKPRGRARRADRAWRPRPHLRLAPAFAGLQVARL